MLSLVQDLIDSATALVHHAAPEFFGDSAGQGPLLVEQHDFSGGGLPLSPTDGSPFPSSDARTIVSNIGAIADVDVWFSLTNPDPGGAFNGDFYMRLEHDSGYAILLNRAGRRAGSDADAAFGYADNGFVVTLDDQAAAGDIHAYRLQLPSSPGGPAGLSHDTAVDPAYGTALTGTWAPDGRDVNPANALAESARTRLLSQFNNLSASGTWTLYVADLSSGGTATLANWGLRISGYAVIPEPAEAASGLGLVLMSLAAWKSWRARRANSRFSPNPVGTRSAR